jgi:hypothetical protein
MLFKEAMSSCEPIFQTRSPVSAELSRGKWCEENEKKKQSNEERKGHTKARRESFPSSLPNSTMSPADFSKQATTRWEKGVEVNLRGHIFFFPAVADFCRFSMNPS